MERMRIGGAVIAGGLIGALLVSVAAHLFFAATSQAMLSDGQYGMIFFATAPLGWLLGAAAAARCSDPEGAHRRAALGIGCAGALLAPFLAMAALQAIWAMIPVLSG